MWSTPYIAHDVIKYRRVYHCSEDKNANGSGFTIGNECPAQSEKGYFLPRRAHGKVCGPGIHCFSRYLVTSNGKFMCNLLSWKPFSYMLVPRASVFWSCGPQNGVTTFQNELQWVRELPLELFNGGGVGINGEVGFYIVMTLKVLWSYL